MADDPSSDREEGHSPASEGGDDTKPRRHLRLVTGGRLFALLLVAAGGILFAGYGHYTDPGPLQADKTVVITRGGTDHALAELQENGVVARGMVSSLFFKVALLVTRSQGGIHAAELNFPARVPLAHVLDILRHGHPVTHSLTIAEGLTALRIQDLLAQAPALQGEVPDVKEGQVAPQTFFYVWGMQRTTLLHHMEGLMDSELKEAWDHRDQAALEGVIATPEQLLVLASLIERETSLPQERPQIARVFLNRLKKGMKLQTDPTVIYALSDGEGYLARPLTHDDLHYDSPYNSYLHAGLPPGPICSPGREALEAAAHPAEGDALFFVATGHGGHNFARTLSEQTDNIRAYRRAQSQN